MTSRRAAVLDSLTIDGDWISARLRLGGAEHVLAYRAPGVALEERYEPFLVAALPIAMRAASSLAVPRPVSARLLDAMPEAQRILNSWDPGLRVIAVDADPAPVDAAPGRGTASFFSGGVDSFYTVDRSLDQLDALLYVRGFDLELERGAELDRVARSLGAAADELGRPLIELETNLRATSDRYCGWELYNGTALASLALVVGAEYRRVLLPASHSYRDLFPWGSHPVLDSLWSTEAVEIVHEGAARRPEKLARIGESRVAMRHLRVCWEGRAAGNCGRCEKCLRTMAGLRIVGALDRCETLPHSVPLGRLARTPIRTENDIAFTRENLDAARSLGADPGLRRTLGWMVQRGRLYQAVRPRRGALVRPWETAERVERRARRLVRRLRESRGDRR